MVGNSFFSDPGSAGALFSFMISTSEWMELSLLICSKIKIYYNFSVFWTSKKGKQKYSKTREIAKNRSRTQFGFEREIEKSKRKDKSKQQWPRSLVISQPGLILRIRTKQTLAKAEIFIDFQECLKQGCQDWGINIFFALDLRLIFSRHLKCDNFSRSETVLQPFHKNSALPCSFLRKYVFALGWKGSHAFAGERAHAGNVCSKSCSSEGKIGQVSKIKQSLKFFKANYAYAAVTISWSETF